ncbi:MAG: asparaginase [Candidatus Nanopelagicales bacterium]
MSEILVEVRRGGVVEGVHRGHAVVLAPDGSIERSWGDPQAQILPRSSNKPAQASAMVRAGLPLEAELLALASASHSGETFHLEGVQRILDEAGLDESALLTPPELPLDEAVRLEVQMAGQVASSAYMNCSGKHAAMLLTCVVNDWPTADYTSLDHPLQQLIADEIAQRAGEQPWASAVDGCGAPLIGLTVAGLARMGAAVASGEDEPARRVADAMRGYPDWVAGTRRDAAALQRSLPGALIKEGAEAVYLVVLPDGRAIALKIEDGGGRARPVAMAGILRAIGVDNDVIEAQARQVLFGGGRPAGEIVPVVG